MATARQRVANERDLLTELSTTIRETNSHAEQTAAAARRLITPTAHNRSRPTPDTPPPTGTLDRQRARSVLTGQLQIARRQLDLTVQTARTSGYTDHVQMRLLRQSEQIYIRTKNRHRQAGDHPSP